MEKKKENFLGVPGDSEGADKIRQKNKEKEANFKDPNETGFIKDVKDRDREKDKVNKDIDRKRERKDNITIPVTRTGYVKDKEEEEINK